MIKLITIKIERTIHLYVINMYTYQVSFDLFNITPNVIDERFVISITSTVTIQLSPKLRGHFFYVSLTCVPSFVLIYSILHLKSLMEDLCLVIKN